MILCKLTFYRKGQVVDEIEGWPGEDTWRYGRIKGIIEFAERYIPKDLNRKSETRAMHGIQPLACRRLTG